MSKLTLLDLGVITRGVYARMDQNRFEGRNSYFGASEVGRCGRQVVSGKLAPVPAEEMFSLPGAWKVNLGHTLENEAVQVLRGGGVDLRETGDRQVEFVHPTIPHFRCHPDGKVLGPIEHEGLVYEGDGSLQVKSTSDYLAKSWMKDGLPEEYQIQVNSEMGLSGRAWSVFMAVWREELRGKGTLTTFSHIWMLRFDHELFCRSEAKADFMESHRLAGTLPEGEPSKLCQYCPISEGCEAYLNKAPVLADGDELPEDVRLELDVILEEMGPLQEIWEPYDKRLTELEKRAKPLVPSNIKRDFKFDAGLIRVGMTSRTDFDAARLMDSLYGAISAAVPGEAGEAINIQAAALFAAEQARKKSIPTISIKPRRAK